MSQKNRERERENTLRDFWDKIKCNNTRRATKKRRERKELKTHLNK